MKLQLIALAALLASSAGFAQAPPTHSQELSNADAQTQMDKGKSVASTQRHYFASLDRNQKGYLNNDDVSADAFLSKNFPKCDDNHDGRLTYGEYAVCTRDNPPRSE